MKIDTIDLNKTEIQNARVQNLASAPANPVVGQLYYDTALSSLMVYKTTGWGKVWDDRKSTLSVGSGLQAGGSSEFLDVTITGSLSVEGDLVSGITKSYQTMTEVGTADGGQVHHFLRDTGKLLYGIGLNGSKSGVSSGGNFSIWAYDNNGSFLREDLSINRNTGAASFGNTVRSTQFISSVATGTSPLVVSSQSLVTNLNADLLDGYHQTSFIRKDTISYGSISVYISPTGSNSNTGDSSSSPLLTMAAALTKIRNMNTSLYRDVTIYLMDGTYNEDMSFSWVQNDVMIQSYSNSASSVTIPSLTVTGCWQVDIKGITIGTTSTHAIKLINCKKVSITGCPIRGVATSYYGVWAAGTGMIVEVINCEISNRNMAIMCQRAQVFAENNSGSGNNFAHYAQNGGKIIKMGSVPNSGSGDGTYNGGTVSTTA